MIKFGWISIFGAGIVVIMLIPNIIYAVKNQDEKNLCTNKIMNLIEQVGRYGCMILMWLPLLVREFAFASVFEMALYLIGNGILLISYLIIFALHIKQKTANKAVILAILPACIFLLSGLLLRHWLLVGFAVLFTIGHIFVTIKNVK